MLVLIFVVDFSAELVEVGHQSLSNYGQLALVSLNVTQLLSHWIANQQPVPTHQTIYLELNGPNGMFVWIFKHTLSV